ncbi:hypothetical protein IWX49DRAFT_91332 [Phyllosticta citricarpa]|uniref:Uncharacterized protein n=2 Tax=Phyllosticta TaxID=121621 RepID=A0ABR1LUW3_9PEZI
MTLWLHLRRLWGLGAGNRRLTLLIFVDMSYVCMYVCKMIECIYVGTKEMGFFFLLLPYPLIAPVSLSFTSWVLD